MRLFVAIDTPAPVKSLMVATIEALRSSDADVRWEPADKLHCTIKFLGDTQPDQVKSIASSLERIASETHPLSLLYRSLGCFPGKRDPRVLWIGIDDIDASLERLFLAVDETMAPHGFIREKRPFHPHVTIGRIRSPRKLAELLTIMETTTFQSQPVVLHRIELIKSDIRPSGSVYTVQHAFALEGQ